MNYYVEDHENGPLRANGAGGPPRTDKQPIMAVHMLQDPISDGNVTPAWGKGTKTGSASIAVVTPTLREHVRPGSNSDLSVVRNGVRRLTPRECERLQAFPDDWTAFGPDSRRYAALGDAVTASVAEWIGRRLRAVA